MVVGLDLVCVISRSLKPYWSFSPLLETTPSKQFRSLLAILGFIILRDTTFKLSVSPNLALTHLRIIWTFCACVVRFLQQTINLIIVEISSVSVQATCQLVEWPVSVTVDCLNHDGRTCGVLMHYIMMYICAQVASVAPYGIITETCW